MKLICLTPETKNLYLQQILDLEREASYPYGDSFFKIDHGVDYFAFFKRLGTLYYYILLDKDKVVGVVATVLITLPTHVGLKKMWYYCDLKIHPDYRGRRLPIKMAYQVYLRNFLLCRNGFSISMNPASGSNHNRIMKLSKWLKWISMRADTQLCLFSLDYECMKKALPVLKPHRGDI